MLAIYKIFKQHMIAPGLRDSNYRGKTRIFALHTNEVFY